MNVHHHGVGQYYGHIVLSIPTISKYRLCIVEVPLQPLARVARLIGRYVTCSTTPQQPLRYYRYYYYY